jgi:Na+/H+-translocating membrane pyrophosphatase
MGADLFGSFAESTCACMVIMASYGKASLELNENILAYSNKGSAILLPLIISAFGIIGCLLTSVVASFL